MREGRVDDLEKGSEGLREEKQTPDDEPDSMPRLAPKFSFPPYYKRNVENREQ